MIRVVIGIGVIAWVVMTLIMAVVPLPLAVWKSEDEWATAWNIIAYPMLISIGVGAGFYVWFNRAAVQTEIQRHRTEKAKLEFEAAHLNDTSHMHPGAGAPPTTGPVVEQPSASEKYAEAWRVYWLGYFTYAKDKGAITFAATQEYFGGNRAKALATWKAILRPWTRQGCINPIEEGQLTTFSRGWDCQGVIDWLEGGRSVNVRYLYPVPPPSPFSAWEQIPVIPENNG